MSNQQYYVPYGKLDAITMRFQASRKVFVKIEAIGQIKGNKQLLGNVLSDQRWDFVLQAGDQLDVHGFVAGENEVYQMVAQQWGVKIGFRIIISEEQAPPGNEMVRALCQKIPHVGPQDFSSFLWGGKIKQSISKPSEWISQDHQVVTNAAYVEIVETNQGALSSDDYQRQMLHPVSPSPIEENRATDQNAFRNSFPNPGFQQPWSTAPSESSFFPKADPFRETLSNIPKEWSDHRSPFKPHSRQIESYQDVSKPQQTFQKGPTQVVSFFVGNKEYTTTFGTLSKIPKLSNLQIYPLHQGKPFIDRDGEIFQFILNCIRSKNPQIYLPDDPVVLAKMRCEAQFYQLPNLEKMVNEKLYNIPISKPNKDEKYDVDSVGMKLLAMKNIPSSAPLISASANSPVLEIPGSDILFEIPRDETYVMINWYIAISSGYYFIKIDETLLQEPLSINGWKCESEDLSIQQQMHYSQTGFIKHVFKLQKGNHRVSLFWRPYDEKKPATIQGPLIVEAFLLSRRIIKQQYLRITSQTP